MKVVVAGGGDIGVQTALILSRMGYDVTLVEKFEGRARRLAARFPELRILRKDALNTGLLHRFGLAVGALPGSLGYRFIRTCIKAGIHVVDVSYMPEDPLKLHDAARASGVAVIPDAGFAPGLTNFLVGLGVSKSGVVDDVKIYVGGLPAEPIPPLGYAATWSIDDLIEEYSRPVRIWCHGKLKVVEPLSGLEVVDVPGVGRLEAFYTDGLRTLLKTVSHKVHGCMWEKTLRYPGHAERILLLKELGFFDEVYVEVGGARVRIRDVTSAVLSRVLRKPVPDLVAMRLQVDNGGWMLVLRKGGGMLSAMAWAVASMAVSATFLLLDGHLDSKGVIPPEMLGMDEGLSRTVLRTLSNLGVTPVPLA